MKHGKRRTATAKAGKDGVFAERGAAWRRGDARWKRAVPAETLHRLRMVPALVRWV